MSFDEPVETTGEFMSPKQLAGHLVIVWPLGYVPFIQTKFTRPDKPSDAICVDVVDLDAMGDDGIPGKLYRTCNWMQAQMIASLRPKIGSKLLGHVAQGLSKNGMNPPWMLNSATNDPQAMARGNAWIGAHPGYTPSEFVAREQRAEPPLQPQQAYQQDPWQQQQQRPAPAPQYQPTPPQYQVPAAPVAGSAQVTAEEMSILQRLRAQHVNDPRLQDQGPIPF